MKALLSNLTFRLLMTILFAVNVSASVLYVDLNSANPVLPFADWSTSATDIQSAIDASADGDLILVTNGIYNTGGRVTYGSLTNRVVINKSVTVQSVNGPDVTVIQGYQVPGAFNGDSAVRCVYMANGAALMGFTLVNGATRNLGDPVHERSGGGVWCESNNGLVSNCIVTINSCFGLGAGVYAGTLNNCRIVNNTNRYISGGIGGGGGAAYSTIFNSTISSNYQVSFPGGAYYCNLSNCIISGNSMIGVMGGVLDYCTVENNANNSNGGGAFQATLNHCMVRNNRAQNGGGAYQCELNFCTVSNNLASLNGGGLYEIANSTNRSGLNNQLVGNSAGIYGGGVYFAVSGQFVQTNWDFSDWAFTSNSAVRDGGGLYEFQSTPLNNCVFTCNSAGGNGGGFSGVTSALTVISNSTFSGNVAVGGGGGAYLGLLNNCLILGNQAGNGGGIYGTMNNSVANNNVAITNGGGMYFSFSGFPAPPSGTNCYFTNNLALNGGGSYGGNFSNSVFFGNGALTNGGGVSGVNSQISTLQSCTVISNQAAFGGGGYGATMQNSLISKNQAVFGGGGYGGSFVGCSIMGNWAANSGGGIFFNLPGSLPVFATNCVIGNNHAAMNGGGVYGAGSATLANCTLTNNSAGTNGGGTYSAYLTSCILSNNLAGVSGGGTYYSTMNNCVLIQNSAVNGGGTYGEYNRLVVGCLFADNTAAIGGGAYGCFLNNSTLVNNTATNIGGGNCGAGAIISCIIYDNSAPSGANYSNAVPLGFCCTTPLPSGNNNITNDPIFVNLATGNYRLQTNSPCINTGYAANAGATDLDGRPRFVGSHQIDIGAYEFQGVGMGEFIAWLQQYGLPTGGSADYKDSDGDGLNNWQEWIAGTNPTNAASVLRLSSPLNSVSGVTVTWQSVTNVTYYLQSSTNLGVQPAFTSIQSNLVGQASSTSYTDTTATNGGPYFYRVGVQ